MTKPTDTVEVLEHPTSYHFNYRESLWNVTKYPQPVTGASSLCEVTLKDFLPVGNVIPSVFCYFPNPRLIFVRHSLQSSFDVRPFLWAALSKFISAILQNYRPWVASGLPEEVLFLI